MKSQRDFYKLKEIVQNNQKEILNQIISILGTIIVIIQFIEIIKSKLNGIVFTKLLLSNILIITAIVAMNIFNYMNKKRILKLETENKNLMEINDKVRCFKHDFNNIIQAIDGYIILNDMNSLQNYFNSLLKECNYVNSIDFLNDRIKENPAIFSILLNKYRLAEERNIKMNIEVMVDLSKLNSKSYILSRMLGILLDNALEACIEAEEKIVNVLFIKEDVKNRVLIKIENTYINKEVNLSSIFEKNYSTKAGNSGLGLWKIKDILRQDKSLDLFTTKDDYMFRQQLEIYG